MLRFTYTSLSVTYPTCLDCKFRKSCYRTTRGYDTRMTCNRFEFENHDLIKVNDVHWDLYQLRKQISSSRSIVETIINRQMMNWAKPDSLKDNDVEKIPFSDCRMFMDVLKIFYDYIGKRKDYIKKSNDLVSIMINTVIVVRDKKVISSSLDKELNYEIKLFVKGTNYSFMTDEPVFENSLGGKENE